MNTKLPWCSSGKVGNRRTLPHSQPSKRKVQSAYFSTENNLEILCNDGSINSSCRKRKMRKAHYLQQRHEQRKYRKVILGTFLLGLAIFGVAIKYKVEYTHIDRAKLLSRFRSIVNEVVLKKLYSFGEPTVSVDEECCYRIKQLSTALLRAELSVKRTRRLQSVILTATQSSKIDLERDYVEGVQATKGEETIEWDGRATLWGIVPLWRASPPPSTILSLRKPLPADCWPFSGSKGEVILELPHEIRLQHVSLEHVRPDAANSAPKIFSLYGLLENGTNIKVLDGEYTYRGPAKQFFKLRHIPLVKRVTFRILSNHGNQKYTCVYRVHVYGNVESLF